jgi:hypothetical protein
MLVRPPKYSFVLYLDAFNYVYMVEVGGCLGALLHDQYSSRSLSIILFTSLTVAKPTSMPAMSSRFGTGFKSFPFSVASTVKQ